MSVQPTGTIIPTPTIPPGSDTLTDIATVISSNDPHLAHGGSYETVCGSGVMIGGNFPCLPVNMNRGLGDLTWVQGVPGTVFTGLQCYGPMDLAEMQASAMKGNDARVNRTIQDNLIGGFIPISEFEVRPATEAGGLADADTVARCEYTGQGVIHIHPALAEQWMGKEIIRVGRHLETVMGAMVSLNCWLPVDQIAVTGWLTVLKGASRVMDPYHDVATSGPNRGSPLNLWYVNVQTPATVFNDCNLAVLISGVTGGGGPDVPTQPVLTSVHPNPMELVSQPATLIAYGTDFTKTSVIYVNSEPVYTTWSDPTALIGIFTPTDIVQDLGTVQVTVSGATGSVPLEFVAEVKDASITVSPAAGQLSGYWTYFRLYEYVGLNNDPQYPDGTTDLTDADIATIDWGDGSAPEAGPFTRYPRPPLTGQFVRHSYLDSGNYNIIADLVGYGDVTYTGYPISPQYNLEGNPSNWTILIGGTMGIRPLDGYQGAPLPPDAHLKTVDWGDGGAAQTAPYTVDGSGYATHVYTTAGAHVLHVVYADDTLSSGAVTVNVAATQEEYDTLVAAYDEEKVEQQRQEDAPEEDATE